MLSFYPLYTLHINFFFLSFLLFLIIHAPFPIMRTFFDLGVGTESYASNFFFEKEKNEKILKNPKDFLFLRDFGKLYHLD